MHICTLEMNPSPIQCLASFYTRIVVFITVEHAKQCRVCISLMWLDINSNLIPPHFSDLGTYFEKLRFTNNGIWMRQRRVATNVIDIGTLAWSLFILKIVLRCLLLNVCLSAANIFCVFLLFYFRHGLGGCASSFWPTLLLVTQDT